MLLRATALGQNRMRQLIHDVASQLVGKRFTVVSGFGAGVGEHVINGAMSALAKEKTRVTDERLVLRPFPRHIADPQERRKRWKEYRKQLLDEAGIAVFLFGTKLTAGRIVNADGVRQEFELATQEGLAVVPVGCTGGAAGVAHSTVMNDCEGLPKARISSTRLRPWAKRGSAAAVAARVVEIVEKLRY